MESGDGKSRLMVAVFDQNTGAVIGQPRVLFDGTYAICSPMRCYDPAPDGQHFVMVKMEPPGSGDPVHQQIALVLNWFDELKRLAPPKR